MIRSMKAVLAALWLLVLASGVAHATASGATPCSGGSFSISANWASTVCPDINEEISNANLRGIINLTSVSGTDTITANASPFALTAYNDGQNFEIKPAVTNTGAVTLNINSVGAKAVVSASGSALSSGDLQSTTIYLVRYYGASDHFRVITALGTGTATPANASYVTMGLNGTLSAERVLTAGSMVSVTDGGANSTATIAVSDAELLALGGVTSAADKLPYFTGSGTAALADLSSAFRTWLTTTSSANLRSAMSDEIGTGVLFFLGAPASDDQIFVSTSTSAGAWGSIPDSDGATQKLQYDVTTNAFSAGTDDDVPDAADYSNLTGGTGIVNSPTGTIAFSFTDKGSDVSLGADECVFTSNATVAGYIVCEGDTANTIETRIVVTDPTSSDKTFTIPDANSIALADGDKGDITVASTGTAWTVDADSIALTTDTTGNYVGSVADGTGIDGTASAEGATYTPTLDLTEISSATWGAGSFTTFTFDAGAVDPLLTFGSGTLLVEGVTSFRQADAANAGGQIKLLEDPGVGSNFITLIAPASIASDRTCTLVDGAAPIPDSCVGDGVDDGAGAAAPTNAEYLVKTLNGTLSAESNLVAGAGIGSTDGGANAAFTLDITADAGIAVSTNGVGFDYSDAGASPALAADTCRFTGDATTNGELVCEGDTADTNETRIVIADPSADRAFTIPNADSNPVQPTTCSNTDRISAISSAGVVTCSHVIESLCVAMSDETTALTTGTAKMTIRMPYAFTLTAVRAWVNTAPTGSTIIVDINEGGSTIMTTNKLSIDASEKTSTTAATAAGLTDTSLADDAEITFDEDQVGSTIAGAGLKACLIGYQT